MFQTDMDITVSPLTITLDQEDVTRKHSRSRLHNNYLFIDGKSIMIETPRQT